MDTHSPHPAPAPAAAARTHYWRAATIGCLLLLLLAGTAGISMFEQFRAQILDLQHKLQATAQLRHVAVLLDDKGAAAMLVTQMAGEDSLQLQRLNSVQEGPEDTLQLWALADSGAARSLGVLPARLPTARVGADVQALDGTVRLAISVESKGGVSQAQGPRLPYLFSGAWVRKAL